MGIVYLFRGRRTNVVVLVVHFLTLSVTVTTANRIDGKEKEKKKQNRTNHFHLLFSFIVAAQNIYKSSIILALFSHFVSSFALIPNAGFSLIDFIYYCFSSPLHSICISIKGNNTPETFTKIPEKQNQVHTRSGAQVQGSHTHTHTRNEIEYLQLKIITIYIASYCSNDI